MKELLAAIVKALVDNPDQFQVRAVETSLRAKKGRTCPPFLPSGDSEEVTQWECCLRPHRCRKYPRGSRRTDL